MADDEVIEKAVVHGDHLHLYEQADAGRLARLNSQAQTGTEK